MPYVQSDGARIHYHVEGDGAPIVMLHGFSDSLADWYEAGYVAALRDEFKLIMFDSRGHGLSDMPRSPEAYAMRRRVADVLAVMDELDITDAHLWGYSMGGRICFSMAERAPERIRSLILAGIDQHGTDPPRFQRRIQYLSRGMDSYLSSFEARFGTMEPPTKRARFLQNDHLALIAGSMDLRDNHEGYERLLPKMTMPALLYDGDRDAFHDGARSCAELLPNGRFASLPGEDHGGTFNRSDLALPLVRGFLGV